MEYVQQSKLTPFFVTFPFDSNLPPPPPKKPENQRSSDGFKGGGGGGGVKREHWDKGLIISDQKRNANIERTQISLLYLFI